MLSQPKLKHKFVLKILFRFLVIALAVLFFNPYLHAQVTFAPAITYTVGSSPTSVAAADVNGDGKVDLICANYTGFTLTILTNNGGGYFVSNTTYSVGRYPRSVVAADINGDGKVDLISANWLDSTLSVLTNDASGRFRLSTTLNVGNNPNSVTAADVKGDGKMDLISANYGADTLSVLTNNGSGSFVLVATPSVGRVPVAVTAADINGDGKVDLISANFGAYSNGIYIGGKTLSVLTNNGFGGFALASALNVGNNPNSVLAADVNGDGWVDLICPNIYDFTLSVLTNNGQGAFVLATTINVGSYTYSVAAVDVNGDGKMDLISANANNSTLSVLTNAGSDGFVLAASLHEGDGPQFVVSADVNGDGGMDLICANPNANSLSVLVNTSGPHAATATAVLMNGFMVAATITDPGNGYTNTPTVSIAGGGGSGAQALATVSNGIVTVITIVNAGFGYTNAPSITISPPFIVHPSIRIASATCLFFTNLVFGSNYQLQVLQLGTWGNLGSSFMAVAGNYSQFVDGMVNGSLYRLMALPIPYAATATPFLTNGFVVSVTISDGGYGYASVSLVQIIGGGGNGSQATATVSNGVVTAINVHNAGFGYTSPPTIQIDSPPVPALLPSCAKAFRLDYGGLKPMLTYQLQAASDLAGWTNFGTSFTATAHTNSQYFNFGTNRQFFRLSLPSSP